MLHYEQLVSISMNIRIYETPFGNFIPKSARNTGQTVPHSPTLHRQKNHYGFQYDAFPGEIESYLSRLDRNLAYKCCKNAI
jgi:hypothetical protein